MVYFIVGLKLIPLIDTIRHGLSIYSNFEGAMRMYSPRITAYRTDVDHPIAELNESSPMIISELHEPRESCRRDSPLDRNVKVGDIMQNKVRELLVSFLAHKLDERLCRELLTKLVRRQSVFRKYVVERIGNYENRMLQLLQ